MAVAEEDVPEWAKAATNPQQALTTLQELEAPETFKVRLRPYQREALWWMTQREAQEELEESMTEVNDDSMTNNFPIEGEDTGSPISKPRGVVGSDNVNSFYPSSFEPRRPEQPRLRGCHPLAL